MKKLSLALAFAAVLGSLIISTQPLFAQGTTAFTYQGQLNDGGTNANGVYTLIFGLYDSVTGGNQIGSNITSTPTLANGLFTVNLDFGTGSFNGSARWLDITVTNGGTSQELSPRVQVLPVPYALFASNADSATSFGNGTWNAGVSNYQTTSNIFGIYANNSLVLGMSSDGVLINGGLEASKINVSNIDFGNNGGGAISGDSQGDITIYTGNTGVLTANNISLTGGNGNPGTITFSNNCASPSIVGGCGGLFITGDITTTGTIRLGTDGNNNNSGGSGLASDGNGGLTFLGSGESGSISGDNEGGLNLNGNVNVWAGDLSVQGDVSVSGDNNEPGNVYVNGDVNAQNFNYNNDGGDEIANSAATTVTSTNAQRILNQVANLTIADWTSKTDPTTRHIGPKAHDFQAAFGVAGKNNKSISLVDESGVALAAIQGLNEKLKEKDAKIESLEKRLSDLEQLVKSSVQK